jgi:dihydrofolate reductase
MRLSLIAAVAENGVIGRGNELPWRLPLDLKRFRNLTMGHHLLMGRKTFESIGRALPGRTTVVLTRSAFQPPPGVLTAGSLQEAIDMAGAAGEEEAFVVGGEEVYRVALPVADRLYLTRVHAVVQGDTFFPSLDLDDWRLLSIERHEPGEANSHSLCFEILEKRSEQPAPLRKP